jgi:hypothetical protein
MNTRHVATALLAILMAGLDACGGGGSAPPASAPPPALTTITLAPHAVSLAPGASAPLTITGTYSDGSTHTLPASGEIFKSSNAAVATVSAAGIVTVNTTASNAATSIITATDTASGIATSTAGATTVTATVSLKLTKVSLAPAAASLAPGGTLTLAVIGTYSDGSSQPLAAAGETFASSNSALATVSAAGIVTVPSTATNGGVAMISATDTASGVATTAGGGTQLTIATMDGAPTATSAAAAASTALNNTQCTAIQPFYWEIGAATGAIAQGSSTQAGGTAVASSTRMPIASASKWIYGMYVVQKRGSAANLTAADISFLTFTSGYTYMGSDTQGATCTAPSSGANSISYCLTLPSVTTPGAYFNGQDSATVGVFDYDSGHEENHAGQFQPEINALDTSALGAAIVSGLNLSGITLRYTQPLLAGGIYASADDYSPILRSILGGQLAMHDALGTHPVCAWVGSGCNAAYSPSITQHWHYSIAHWVEDDPTTGDGAFSSPGAFGFYPWIDANKKYYGVISRYSAATGVVQNGLNSAYCGHQLRAAWETGVEQ